MKKSILMLSVIFLIAMELKAQQESQLITANSLSTTNPVSFSMASYSGPDKDADFYLRRSKNQRIAGWATLGGGLLLSGIGFLIINADVTTNSGNDGTAAVLFITGAASGIVSIPFMIMARANKHKAKLMLSNQKTGFGVPQHVDKNIMGVTMSLPIGK